MERNISQFERRKRRRLRATIRYWLCNVCIALVTIAIIATLVDVFMIHLTSEKIETLKHYERKIQTYGQGTLGYWRSGDLIFVPKEEKDNIIFVEAGPDAEAMFHAYNKRMAEEAEAAAQ